MIISLNLPNLYLVLHWRGIEDQLNLQELFLVQDVSFTYGKIQVEVDPFIKLVELTSHVDDAHRFTDIYENDETLELKSFLTNLYPRIGWSVSMISLGRNIYMRFYLVLFHCFSLMNDPIKIKYRDMAIDKEKFIVPFKRVRELLHCIISVTLYYCSNLFIHKLFVSLFIIYFNYL